MRFICKQKCFFNSDVWKPGQVVSNPDFAQCTHFDPMDKEALKEASKYREGIEIPEDEPDIELDEVLMSQSVQALRQRFPGVEWKANMRKPDFVKSIMESGQWQAR
jgi:hypothetical protein